MSPSEQAVETRSDVLQGPAFLRRVALIARRLADFFGDDDMRPWLTAPRLDEALVFRVAVLALGLALAFRLWPLVTGMPDVAQFFVTEDGYLMLTVARNFAIGLGLSASDGTIPTNGVQPLATFLYAVPYLLTGGDKIASLYLLHVLWAAIAFGGALAVRALAARILGPMGLSPVWSWFAAALWFCGPLLTQHTMNGLETGLYTLLILLACLQLMRVVDRGAAAGRGDLLLLAAAMGVVFLGRNDGIFLVLSLAGAWMFHALFSQRLGVAALVRSLIGPALLCAALVAPWLIHNQVFFGSVVPISGTAQSMSAALGENATLMPAVLFEQMFPILPLPGRIETSLPVVVITALAVVVILTAFVVRAWRVGGAVRLVVLAYLFHAVAITVYYGLFFGAPHFMSRYTAPLAPLMIMAMVTFAWDLAQRASARRAQTTMAALSVGALLLSLGLLLRLLTPGANEQGHFQVVDWVERNVPADTWVGAVQTGTLGYWHDRTINLDGKVNPEALQARRDDGHVLNYIVASQITYLADWVDIADWVNREGFGAHFELVLTDPAANLTVLRRR